MSEAAHHNHVVLAGTIENFYRRGGLIAGIVLRVDAGEAAQIPILMPGVVRGLRTRLRDWRTRAETAESLVVSLLTQLVGGVDGTPVYLRSISGEGVSALDRHAVNGILARAGLQLKSKATASARVVQTVLEPGKVQAHSVFWVTKAPTPGVVDPEDADEDLGAASRSG
jgi:hypothetical protein